MTGTMFDPTPEAERKARLQQLARYFETLDRTSLARLDHFYAPEARFKDPFNDVTGLPAIRAIFEHMFAQLDNPRFIITGQYLGTLQVHEEAMLRWDMRFHAKVFGPQEQSIVGCSQIVFDAQGRVLLHLDHWDAAGEMYEKLPFVRVLARWLRRRLAVPMH